MNRDKLQGDALERLRKMMKKDARSRSRTRRYRIVFSYPAILQKIETEETTKDTTLLKLVDGLQEDAELAEYLDDEEMKEKLDLAGGDISYRMGDNLNLWMDISYRARRKPSKKELLALGDYNVGQLLDGWGEGGGIELPDNLEGWNVDFDEKKPSVSINELTDSEAEKERIAAKQRLEAEESAIDSEIDASQKRLV